MDEIMVLHKTVDENFLYFYERWHVLELVYFLLFFVIMTMMKLIVVVVVYKTIWKQRYAPIALPWGMECFVEFTVWPMFYLIAVMRKTSCYIGPC